ncbi:MAG: rRNA pseudouridine synthase, partial [Candidatus Cloacimonetes bacterium]|nr:rRNA pseudouridine synthase [Candidatus Cloacimonadota bacterium]
MVKSDNTMRLNKYLARCGLGSRRKAEQAVTDGEITINGEKVTDLAVSVNPEEDTVCHKGEKLSPAPDKIYIMLNKPPGYLTTAKDDFKRKTVFALLPDFKTRLFYIGRLDYRSEGLLLLTNDGDFAEKVIHPRQKLP